MRAFTFFVIDDDSSVRTSIALILKKSGYNVMEAGNPESAIQIWLDCSEVIDLLMVDFMLPGMQGPDLVRELFKKRSTRPIIFATGVDRQVAIQQTADIPGAAVLQKPFSPKALIQLIQEKQKAAAPRVTE